MCYCFQEPKCIKTEKANGTKLTSAPSALSQHWRRISPSNYFGENINNALARNLYALLYERDHSIDLEIFKKSVTIKLNGICDGKSGSLSQSLIIYKMSHT